MSSEMTTNNPARILYRNQKVEGVNIFYREAGSPTRPTIVLLHGYPSSSHMFRELIPRLAGKYHVIAADMPGFGYSDAPWNDEFPYNFEHLAEVMDKFLDAICVPKYSIYVQDYGSPIGFRLLAMHPEKIEAIISQNGNAYEEGLGEFWGAYLAPFWKNRDAETEAKVRELVTLDATKFQYFTGVSSAEHISPDGYLFDQRLLDRPGIHDIQVELFYDYRKNVELYPEWHAALRKAQPPLLAVWGKGDQIFVPAGAEAFRRDVPKAEIHFVDSGHFALEEEPEAIAGYILAFLAKHVG
jgi:pimeloyl-ACP methyl ester carboxylesterase